MLLKMHKITQNSLLKKHGIFCLTFSFSAAQKIYLAKSEHFWYYISLWVFA